MKGLTFGCFVASVLAASVVDAQPRGAAPPQGAREVTVDAIPGVVAAGATWTLAWQGTNNADGIVGTADGGLLFAQEQPNQISKLDKDDRVSVFLGDTHGTGALSVDTKGRILAVEKVTRKFAHRKHTARDAEHGAPGIRHRAGARRQMSSSSFTVVGVNFLITGGGASMV